MAQQTTQKLISESMLFVNYYIYFTSLSTMSCSSIRREGDRPGTLLRFFLLLSDPFPCLGLYKQYPMFTRISDSIPCSNYHLKHKPRVGERRGNLYLLVTDGRRSSEQKKWSLLSYPV